MAVGKVIITFEDDRRDMAIEVTWIVAIGLHSWFSWEMQFTSPVPRSIESLKSGLPEPTARGWGFSWHELDRTGLPLGRVPCYDWTSYRAFIIKREWIFWGGTRFLCRFQWPRGLRRRFAVARLPRLWVRIPPGAWIFICYECCVLLGRGLCDELITRREESYRLWCVVVFDLETLWMRRPWTGGCRAKNRHVSYICHSLWDVTVELYMHTENENGWLTSACRLIIGNNLSRNFNVLNCVTKIWNIS